MILLFNFYSIAKERLFFILIFFFSSSHLISQTNTRDSLQLKLKLFSENAAETTEYVSILNKLAHSYRFINPDSLKFYADKALNSSQRISYFDGEIEASIRQGDYYSDIGNPKKADEVYKSIQNQLLINEHPKLLVELLKSMSLNHFFNEDIKKGFDSSYKAISIAKNNNLKKTEATLRHNLGYVYWSNNLYDEAQEEYIIADSLWNISGDAMDLAITKSNIALNALDKGDLKMARVYIDKSIDFLAKTQNLLWISRIYRVNARYFVAKRMFDTALSWNQKSDSILKLIDNPRDELQANELFSKIYINKNELKKAEPYILEMHSLAKKINDQRFIKQSYFYLKELEFQIGNLPKMITYQRAFDSLSLKINVAGKINNLKFLRAKQEFDKEQLRIKLENEKKLSQQKSVNRVIVFALIISLIIAMLIRQNNSNQKEANRKLKEINSTKDRIFSIIGHDLKTPLNTLKELLELFKDKAISPKEMIALTPRIQNNVDYSTFTLNNLLYWAQSQMDGIRADPSKMNITKIVADTIAVFSIEALKKNIQIRNKITAEYIVDFDCEHLRIIFRNLISNAIKFTPNNGEIEICSDSTSIHTTIKICDTGIGIDENTYSKLFNQDKMYSTKGTNNEKGTGLGLSICKELLQKNNSLLKIEPNSPNGSCFIITIPKT
ncbi:sensor histidine kinase [Croceitalea marina]|uniref:histidine kinase n=1 Tax=Croceitalea marina TaxID=1775166 RepID=A0ABW5MVV2_9FLAO